MLKNGGGVSASNREILKDKNYKAEDYLVDPSLRNGPVEARRCTDVFCCFSFVIFLAVYSFTAHYAFANGQPH